MERQPGNYFFVICVVVHAAYFLFQSNLNRFMETSGTVLHICLFFLQPVKPTAVRATNSNTSSSSTNCSQSGPKSAQNSSTPSKPVSGQYLVCKMQKFNIILFSAHAGGLLVFCLLVYKAYQSCNKKLQKLITHLKSVTSICPAVFNLVTVQLCNIFVLYTFL